VIHKLATFCNGIQTFRSASIQPVNKQALLRLIKISGAAFEIDRFLNYSRYMLLLLGFLATTLLFADPFVLDLGPIGTVRYTYADGHLLQVERLSLREEVLYSHTYLYNVHGQLVGEQLIGDLGDIIYEQGSITTPYSREEVIYNNGEVIHSLDGVTHRYSLTDQGSLIESPPFQSTLRNAFGYTQEQGDTQFFYDENGRVVEVYTPDAIVSYLYDEVGNRLSRTVNNETEYFLHLGLNEYAVLNDQGSLKELRIPGLSFHKDILRPIAIETERAIYAPIHDICGNIIKLIDIQTKEVLTLASPDPFGRGLSKEAPTSWIFSHKHYDPVTNLVYFGHRYYCPDIGEWLTPDPLHQSSNLYEYCLHNPLFYQDPDGRFALAIPILQIAWGAGGAISCPLWGPAALITVGVAATAYATSHAYKAYKQSHEETEKEPPYNGKDLGLDPTKCPGEGFEWRGKSDPKSGKGSWHNPNKQEGLHPDFNHPGNIKPHWDYEGPNGEKARIYIDGTFEWK
jgi:RHS repeat-associated protein